MKKITLSMMLALLTTTFFFQSCSDDTIGDAIITMPENFNIDVDEKSPNGTVIIDFANSVSITEGTLVFNISTQTPSGALSIQGSKLVVADDSKLDYDDNTEITGIIEASVGAINKTATFTVSLNEVADKIQDLLTTSLTAFTASGNDLWVEVTETEYNLLASSLTNITVGGLKDDDFENTADFSSNYTQSFSTTTDGSIVVSALPTQSYIFGFKFISKASSNNGIKLKASTTSTLTGFSDVSDAINISGSSNGKTHYFINKSTNVQASESFLAIYTGSASLGGVSTGVAKRYYFNGEATPSTTLQGPTSGNLPTFQTLSTTTKQW